MHTWSMLIFSQSLGPLAIFSVGSQSISHACGAHAGYTAGVSPSKSRNQVPFILHRIYLLPFEETEKSIFPSSQRKNYEQRIFGKRTRDTSTSFGVHFTNVLCLIYNNYAHRILARKPISALLPLDFIVTPHLSLHLPYP